MTWVAAAGTAFTVGTQIFTQQKANKAQAKSDAFLQQRRNDLTSKLNASQNRDVLSTDSSRAALALIQKNMKETRTATQNSAIQGGATPEAVIATEGKMQDRYQNAIGAITQHGDELKQRDKYLYENIGQNNDNLYAGSLAGKIAGFGQAQENINGAASGIMNAWANGAFNNESGASRASLLQKYKFTPGTSAGIGQLPK